MRARCLNPNNADYPDYGGRGVKVCERWNDFAAFVSDMGRRPDGFSIDRMDVNGDYEPSNCRWADAVTQASNKRNSKIVEWNGERKTLSAWCRDLGVDRTKVRYRIKAGYSLDAAFATEDYRR